MMYDESYWFRDHNRQMWRGSVPCRRKCCWETCQECVKQWGDRCALVFAEDNGRSVPSAACCRALTTWYPVIMYAASSCCHSASLMRNEKRLMIMTMILAHVRFKPTTPTLERMRTWGPACLVEVRNVVSASCWRFIDNEPLSSTAVIL